MNTNDLPLGPRLAALATAGRAANPDIEHARGVFLEGNRACFMGFAALACGDRETVREWKAHLLMKEFGISDAAWSDFMGPIRIANDGGASFEEIAERVATGELLPAMYTK